MSHYRQVLLIDNYDSFVWNLARYVRELGHEVRVVRNDAASAEELLREPPSHIIISPGPRAPDQAGCSVELVRHAGETIPILGVCLGHQCIGAAYGGRITAARHPMHGKTSQVHHGGQGVFRGLPSPFPATRYHSLAVAEEGLPEELEITARTDDGEIMGLSHRRFPVHGVQFHPESILTDEGYGLLSNFLTEVGRSGGREVGGS